MKVAIIGCGNIAKTHLSVLSGMDNITISSFVDICEDKAKALAEEYCAGAYSDYITMLDELRPDSVHICTPHYLHKEMSVNCLKRGIHVLCEKPAVITYEELGTLRAAQDNSSAYFGVCLQNRYNESVKMALGIIKDSRLGKLTGVRGNVFWCRNEDYYKNSWHGKKELEGGGVIINQAIHTLDLMNYLAGSQPFGIEAHLSNDFMNGKKDTEDTAIVRLEYPGGLTGYLSATTCFSLDADSEINLYFERGEIIISGLDAYLKESGGKISRLTSARKGDITGKPYWGNGHIDLIRDFYDCIENGRPFNLDAYEGGKVIEVISAIYDSAEIKKKVYID